MSESVPNAVQEALAAAGEEVRASTENAKEAGRQPSGNHVARLDLANVKPFDYEIDGIKGKKFLGFVFPWVIEQSDNPAIDTERNPQVRHRVRCGPYKDKKSNKLVLESIDLQPYKGLYRDITGSEPPTNFDEWWAKFFEVANGCRANVGVQDDKKNPQYQRVYINGLAEEE